MLDAAKGSAVGEADAVVFEEFYWIFEFELSDVEPREVGRFHRAEGDAGDLLFDEFVDQLVIATQIRDQVLTPRFTVIVSGFAARIAKAVYLGDDAANRFLELEA